MTKKHGGGGWNVAQLPNGPRLHLQDRNPLAGDTRTDLAKAAAVAAEFGLVFDCGLDEAAAIYDGILHASAKEVSHRLLDRARQLRTAMKVETPDQADSDNARKILH